MRRLLLTTSESGRLVTVVDSLDAAVKGFENLMRVRQTAVTFVVIDKLLDDQKLILTRLLLVVDGQLANRLANTIKCAVRPTRVAGRQPLVRRKDLEKGQRTNAYLPE